MPNRTAKKPRSTDGNDAALCATAEGTSRYAQQFAPSYLADHFRATTFGLHVSSIGIGTYLGEPTDEDDARYASALETALRCGINLVDTAINYRNQRSERVVGRTLQRLIATGTVARDAVVVCSKGGYIPLDQTPVTTRDQYREYLKREFFDAQIVHPEEVVAGGHSVAPRFLRYCLAKSRQNLGVRTIDVYYVHNPGQQLASVEPDEWRRRMLGAFEVLEEAATRGEIGVYGAATWDELRVPPGERGHVSLETLAELAHEVAGDAHHFRAIQLPINLAMTEAVRVPTQRVGDKTLTVIQAADALDLTVIASATLMQARLASGLPEQVRAHFEGYTTDAQRAIAFTRTIDGVTSALVGMKHSEHIEENMGAVAPRPA